ncbi:tRNA-splicing endonuclease subunit Sen34 [Trichonephila clavata]|uniref:tRNA-intron lyase n=1 Tax=Trichonephila clavata TaxID=2740835 RepID=A0A8X6LW87_TRICU|nr:tRNA-splicing endonuclease subunit Sen34 [Trichonephila clavata]
MINLYFCNDKAFVWNAEDACTLRKKYRIVGSLVGSYPIKPFQIETKWLPLQLMPEETKLLVEKGIAQLISIPDKITDSNLIESFYLKRDQICAEQVSVLKENRKQQILEKADQIYEGKKRKYLQNLEKSKKTPKLSEVSNVSTENSSELKTSFPEENSSGKDNSNSSVECRESLERLASKNLLGNEKCDSESSSQAQDSGFINIDKSEGLASKDSVETGSKTCGSDLINIDKDAIIAAELAKVTDVNKEFCMVQFFTESLCKQETTSVNLNFPSSEKEKLRYAVYKDLWEKNYYITAGVKFGGDFLVYEGDPLKYHALFIIVCLTHGQRFQGYDLIVYGRLGHQVKKTVALASWDADGGVDYISLSWENEMT